MERQFELEAEEGIFEDFSEVERVEGEKTACLDLLEKGDCNFYQMMCFHTASNRCFRARPRLEEESQPWMGDICRDCNEAVCNDCHAFREYQRQVEETGEDLYFL